jgi:Arabinogalactan endo-1,4-beta-galactosidase
MKNVSFTFAIVILFFSASCEKNEKPEEKPNPPVENNAVFAKGADISWLTEMEHAGKKFYTTAGKETDCIILLRSLGMDAIRLRVWVNPVDGWCNKEDMLVKAIRAHNLGMRLMINFHYSDWWADPGQQTKPATWKDLPLEELKSALANHTREVLNLLKSKDITPEWVQVGNETGNGMLWEDGKASVNMKNYVQLNNAGYDAVKTVFPDAKVIVHLQGGNDNNLYRWLFDGLKNNGGKWDVIGMSLYPSKTTWSLMNTECIANINDMIKRYNTEVMICEVGMPWDEATACKAFLTDLITKAKAVENKKCLGIFYWEPQSHARWNGYTLGAFDSEGRPTEAMDAFN